MHTLYVYARKYMRQFLVRGSGSNLGCTSLFDIRFLVHIDCDVNQTVKYNFLPQAIPMDPSGRVSLLDLTASLEGAMLGEGKTQSGGHHWCIVLQ